jgi:hypothetical protein
MVKETAEGLGQTHTLAAGAWWFNTLPEVVHHGKR